ncbi:MAG: hypothetical protein JWS12_609 [Candidatus Saccharibacteria bacterium]|nr:hypothetical protein [Candidatus Saccharibacteria bacterium]
MTTEPTIEEAAEAQVIRVTQLAGDTVTLDYEPGVTVQEALDRANVRLVAGQVVTLNGAPAAPTDEVTANSVLVVVGKVING